MTYKSEPSLSLKSFFLFSDLAATKSENKQKQSSDSIARLDELKGGMQFKVSRFDMGVARYYSIKLWPSTYHAEHEPEPSSSLAMLTLEKL